MTFARGGAPEKGFSPVPRMSRLYPENRVPKFRALTPWIFYSAFQEAPSLPDSSQTSAIMHGMAL